MPFVAPWERRIILCRHGHVAREAADLQENAFYGGNFDVPLSAGGDADMRAVAEYIASQHYSEAAATRTPSPTAAVSGCCCRDRRLRIRRGCRSCPARCPARTRARRLRQDFSLGHPPCGAGGDPLSVARGS